MKHNYLSIEQMHNLIELGLDVSEASTVIYPEFFLGRDVIIDKYTLSVASSGEIDFLEHVFNYTDIINILPPVIKSGNVSYLLNYDKHNRMLSYFNTEKCPKFAHEEDFLHIQFDNDMLDAAYNMLVWCINNGYVETNKED